MKSLSDPTIDIYPIDHAEDLAEAFGPMRDSGVPVNGNGLTQRVTALEAAAQAQTERLERDFSFRLDQIENLLNLQIVSTREELHREAAERREQFAHLAAKFSRYLERLEQRALEAEEHLERNATTLRAEFAREIAETRRALDALVSSPAPSSGQG